jgi:prevent-host-death family protein
VGIMSINAFNRNISAALAEVQRGQDLILTKRGERVARITSEGLHSEAQESQKADIAWWLGLMDEAGTGKSPATYEERTGRSEPLR